MPRRSATRQKPGPKPAKQPPSYRHYKPKDLGVVRIRGRDRYLGKFGSPESWEKYYRLLAEDAAHGGVNPATATNAATSGLTVKEVTLRYDDFATGYYVKNGKPTTEAGLIRLSLKALNRIYGNTLASEFGPKALKTLRQAHIDAGLARTEVNRRTGHIVRCFKWATEEELVPSSVYHGLSAVSTLRRGHSTVRESPPVLPVADDLVDAIEPHVSPQVWAMIQIQRRTGARPGEVCQMRTCDLDVTGEVWLYRPESHKTQHKGKGRVIPIGPRAQAVLRPWLKTELQAYIFSPKESEQDRAVRCREARKTRVQPSQRHRKKKGRDRKLGDRWSVMAYYHAIVRACDRVFPHPEVAAFKEKAKGLKRAERRQLREELKSWKAQNAKEFKAWRKEHRWHPNQLRHNAATAIRREEGLDAARAVLGHSDAATTTIYAERDLNRAVAVAQKLG